MEVEEFDIDGRPLTDLALQRLNFWIQADGAWRCSKLPHLQCIDILQHVLFGGRSSSERVGTAGGGRLRPEEVDDGNAPLAPVAPRESHDLHVNDATPRRKYRKNERGPVTRERALQMFRELED